ncbi:MotA/TolQ/ExbB proton channel family protein [Prochlorococcus marinus]|uniref:MotA/TolQ/ExbB proton channel family protein n=1 Tax=Prochlorococcus marinus TaxID=1219 RepID=UPI0008FEDCD3|nr:MotA/TolQ/ExbB proton channel family protein [Prochlorococcus marinus]
MWPLLFFSIISFACIIERFIFWKRVVSLNRNNLNSIAEKFSNLENLPQSKNKNDLYNPYKKLLLKVKEFNLNNQKNLSIALAISLQSIQYEFDKFNNFFSTTIAISPLLGLLGTVFGLINSFSFIDIGNIGVNAEEVTGGISEALISTAAGLIIAIFTLIFSNYFKAIRNKQLRIMNEFCGKFETIYSTKKF